MGRRGLGSRMGMAHTFGVERQPEFIQLLFSSLLQGSTAGWHHVLHRRLQQLPQQKLHHRIHHRLHVPLLHDRTRSTFRHAAGFADRRPRQPRCFPCLLRRCLTPNLLAACLAFAPARGRGVEGLRPTPPGPMRRDHKPVGVLCLLLLLLLLRGGCSGGVVSGARPLHIDRRQAFLLLLWRCQGIAEGLGMHPLLLTFELGREDLPVPERFGGCLIQRRVFRAVCGRRHGAVVVHVLL